MAQELHTLFLPEFYNPGDSLRSHPTQFTSCPRLAGGGSSWGALGLLLTCSRSGTGDGLSWFTAGPLPHASRSNTGSN